MTAIFSAEHKGFNLILSRQSNVQKNLIDEKEGVKAFLLLGSQNTLHF
jgi:hypothetical protein